MEGKKQIEVIEEKCEKLGLNVYEVFRRANITTSTITNWRRKEPDAFSTVKKIDETIAEMVKEKEPA